MDEKLVHLLFFVGCLPARYVLSTVITASTTMWWLSTVIGLGFFTLYALDLRIGPVPETGGKMLWWHQQRLVHAVMYGTAAYLLNQEKSYSAFIVLIADIVFSVLSYGRLRLNLY